MFFSTTDRKGIIRSGNEVFMRVSGYAGKEMIGQPHNLIRHPDMPRAVFRLIWKSLQSGKAVAGYVKNLCADGRYYWVVAMLTPLPTGYLSVRFKPTSETHAVIEQLYRDMRQLEQAAGGDGMEQATEKMLGALRQLGFADYDAFMSAMLHTELKSRDATIVRQRGQLLPPHIAADSSANAGRLQAIYESCHETYDRLNVLYNELDEYTGLHRELKAKCEGVTGRAAVFRLATLNATVKAVHLGDDGRCIGVVAGYLRDASARISGISSELAERMRPVAMGLQAVIFNLAAARLQLEMIMMFCHELATEGTGSGVDAHNVADLQLAFDGTIQPVITGLQATGSALHGFGTHAEEFRKITIALQVAQISGSVEARRLRDDGSLAQTFIEVRQQTEDTKVNLHELTEVIARFDLLAGAAPELIGKITAAIAVTRHGVDEFLALLDSAAANKVEPTIDAELAGVATGA